MRSGAAAGAEESKREGGRTASPFFNAAALRRHKKWLLSGCGKEPKGLFVRENGMTAWVAPCRGFAAASVYHSGRQKVVER